MKKYDNKHVYIIIHNIYIYIYITEAGAATLEFLPGPASKRRFGVWGGTGGAVNPGPFGGQNGSERAFWRVLEKRSETEAPKWPHGRPQGLILTPFFVFWSVFVWFLFLERFFVDFWRDFGGQGLQK